MTEEDLRRYSRQMILPGWGGRGQDALARARVAIVGAGGLGSPAALYLTAAGVGAIGIIDDDRVDLSNLHRQILHGVSDLGGAKTASAERRLRAVNPGVRVETHAERLTALNAGERLAAYDLILDGSDNFETRYTVNDAARALGKPLVWGAVLRWEGQAMTVTPGASACYRCVFPEPPDADAAASCADAGVAGPAAGLVGSIMALEALKLLTGAGRPLTNRLLLVDGARSTFRERPVRPRGDCAACAAAPRPTTV